MPDIRVLTDIRKGKIEIARHEITDAEIKILGRLPHGTREGNSTIAIYAELREPIYDINGNRVKFVFCETTLALFQMANGAFEGAEEFDKQNGAN